MFTRTCVFPTLVVPPMSTCILAPTLLESSLKEKQIFKRFFSCILNIFEKQNIKNKI